MITDVETVDDEFLVVWDGFHDPPWESRSEPELREFLLERVAEGYTFPVNPVWPVRDPGWFGKGDGISCCGSQKLGRSPRALTTTPKHRAQAQGKP